VKERLKLFSNPAYNKLGSDLVEKAIQCPFFTNSSRFNPSIEYADVYLSASRVDEVSVSECKEYILNSVSYALKANYRQGKTRLPDQVLAGIFIEILKRYGIDEFNGAWDRYITDFIESEVPCNVFNVYDLVKNAVIHFELPKIPNRSNLLVLKAVSRWQHDLKVNECWCNEPRSYNLNRDKFLYSAFKSSTGLNIQNANSFIVLRRKWGYNDAWAAMSWCILTGVHPIRLLNFIGYWMTHKDGQPIDFSRKFSKTQEYEVECRRHGEIVGYDVLKPQFSAAFIYQFSVLTQQITWFDENGKFIEMISDEFLHFAKCFVMQDFYILGGLEWQELPLKSSGSSYYKSAGLLLENQHTMKEISDYRADKLRVSNSKAIRKSVTGNPLFDNEVLFGEFED